MSTVSVFFPLRAGSNRVIDKNTRPFRPDGCSLFQHKMQQLEKLAPHVVEIVVSTNDEQVIAQFEGFAHIGNARLVRRPDALCTATTKLRDLIDYVPSIIDSSDILWLHATSPFMTEEDYLSALDIYSKRVTNGDDDSLMSVNRLQQFIWNDVRNEIINCDRAINPWPNTQDLEPLFEINSGLFISKRQNYLSLHDRIGIRPALFECDGLKKIDIDWESDFMVAQGLFELFSRDLDRP